MCLCVVVYTVLKLLDSKCYNDGTNITLVVIIWWSYGFWHILADRHTDSNHNRLHPYLEADLTTNLYLCKRWIVTQQLLPCWLVQWIAIMITWILTSPNPELDIWSQHSYNNRFTAIAKSTCVSRHLQLRTGGFCWCKVPACLFWGQPAYSE